MIVDGDVQKFHVMLYCSHERTIQGTIVGGWRAMIRLNEMAVFERVVREGSYTAAARELGLSKSSVSEQVARLEDALGVRLLERSTRSMRLTDVGRVYYDYCRRIVTEANDAAAAVQRASVEATGRLRVTAPTLFGEAFLSPIVNEYLARHRRVSVDVWLTERMVDVIDEGFDVAVRIGHLEDSSLHVRTLGQARSIFVASPHYLEVRGVPESAGALAGHDCIIVGKGASDRWPVAGSRGVTPVSVTGRIAVNSLTMGLAAARSGLGVAWLPTFLCHEALSSRQLQRVLLDATPPAYPICAVYSSKRHMSPRVRTFLDLLVEMTHKSPPWAVGMA